MSKRIPGIFLTPKQLEERARVVLAKANKLRGMAKDKAIREATQDVNMATMKRIMGEGDTA